MTLEERLYTAIVTQFPALAGNLYPGRLPEKATFPAIAYFTVSDPAYNTLQGTTNFSRPRIQFGYWDDSHSNMADFRETFRAFMAGFSDTVIQGIEVDNVNDGQDIETGLYFFHMDCLIWYTRG